MARPHRRDHLPRVGAHRARRAAVRAVAAVPLPRPRRARGPRPARPQGVPRRQAAHRVPVPAGEQLLAGRRPLPLRPDPQLPDGAARGEAAQAAAGVRVLHDQAARADAHPGAHRPHAGPHGHPDPAGAGPAWVSPAATWRRSPRTSSPRSPSPSSASSSAASRSWSASSATASTRRTSPTWSTCSSCSRARTSGSAPGAGSPRPASGTAKSPSSTRSRKRTPSARPSPRCPRRRTSRCSRWPPRRPAAAAAARRLPQRTPVSPAEKTAAGRTDEGDGLTFDDPSMDWSRDDDPFADLGPVDPEGTDDPKPRGAGGPSRRR